MARKRGIETVAEDEAAVVAPQGGPSPRALRSVTQRARTNPPVSSDDVEQGIREEEEEEEEEDEDVEDYDDEEEVEEGEEDKQENKGIIAGSIGTNGAFASAFAQILSKQEKKGEDVAGVKAIAKRLEKEKLERQRAKAARFEKLRVSGRRICAYIVLLLVLNRSHSTAASL